MPKASWNGVIVAESDETVVVDGNHYFPPDSVRPEFFKESATTSVCGWKGTARYHTLEADGKRNEDAAWYYPDPKPDAAQIKEGTIPELVEERATLAFEAGADGVIASPQEARRIRGIAGAAGKLIVTPGVRPAGSALGDQRRVMTPAEAIAEGADHVVVGRPVHQADDPRTAVLEIIEEIRAPQARQPNHAS